MFFMSNRFLKDRADAGVQLARKLKHYRDMRDEAIVLGLPRGGIVIGYHVAHELRLPLDMIVSRKIGCPGHEEYAVGALAQVCLQQMTGCSGTGIEQSTIGMR